jgi:predicted glycoside hydrolase/deacetylase ChbG (UPF0249 family)
MPQITIAGDDLGYSFENNAGIIKASASGILTRASLMTGGDAVEDAITLVRQHRNLAIGLHVSFNDTRPVLPPEEVHSLVQTNGRFPAGMTKLRAAACTRSGRRQIRAEIAAQFDVFQTIGIACDHVNTHRHSHLHPAIALLVFQEAARRKVTTTRIPWDPPADPARYMRAIALRRLAGWYGLRAPDRSIGRQWCVEALISYLADVRGRFVEIYFHPVDTTDHIFAADLPLLLNPRVKAALYAQSRIR